MAEIKETLQQLSMKVPKNCLDFFKSEAKKVNLSQGDFFNALIEIYKKSLSSEPITVEKVVEKEVIKEIEVLPASLQEILKNFPTADEGIQELIENFHNPKEKIVEKEIIKEVVKETPTPLKENQVVFTFHPEVQRNARKVRPFMLKDQILKSPTPEAQIDEFLNYAAKYFMRHKYDNIINPL